jgi:hypothetical protein
MLRVDGPPRGTDSTRHFVPAPKATAVRYCDWLYRNHNLALGATLERKPQAAKRPDAGAIENLAEEMRKEPSECGVEHCSEDANGMQNRAFTEGFETLDLKKAKALLDELHA